MQYVSITKNYDFYSNANLSKYAGQWVIIIDEKVVAHGKKLKSILKKVKEKFPQETPFVVKVPLKEFLIW